MLKTSKHDAMTQCQSQRASPGRLLHPYINAPKTSVSRGILSVLSCPSNNAPPTAHYPSTIPLLEKTNIVSQR